MVMQVLNTFQSSDGSKEVPYEFLVQLDDPSLGYKPTKIEELYNIFSSGKPEARVGLFRNEKISADFPYIYRGNESMGYHRSTYTYWTHFFAENLDVRENEASDNPPDPNKPAIEVVKDAVWNMATALRNASDILASIYEKKGQMDVIQSVLHKEPKLERFWMGECYLLFGHEKMDEIGPIRMMTNGDPSAIRKIYGRYFDTKPRFARKDEKVLLLPEDGDVEETFGFARELYQQIALKPAI